VTESGIDDLRLWHSEQQFAWADSGVFASLSKLPFVGGGIEFAEVGNDLRRQEQALKDACICVLGRNQPVCVFLVELHEPRHSVAPTCRVEHAPHLLKTRNPGLHHKLDGRPPSK